jgi:hypothetical protein
MNAFKIAMAGLVLAGFVLALSGCYVGVRRWDRRGDYSEYDRYDNRYERNDRRGDRDGERYRYSR